MRHLVAVLLLSASALSCSFFPPVQKVPLSFSVHVKNDLGSVVGLKLRVTGFKTDEFLKLTDEQQSTANPEQFVVVIAESITDTSGVAHFNLTTPGNFTLEPNHPAGGLNSVVLDVVPDTPPATVEFQWPASAILRTRQLRGHLSDGLMSSRSAPIRRVDLSVRELISYTEIAASATSDSGSFEFDSLPNGIYFLRVNGGADKRPNQLRGNIAVYIGGDSPRDTLSVVTNYSSCGLSYDLEENKARYKPQACFKGGKPIPCKY